MSKLVHQSVVRQRDVHAAATELPILLRSHLADAQHCCFLRLQLFIARDLLHVVSDDNHAQRLVLALLANRLCQRKQTIKSKVENLILPARHVPEVHDAGRLLPLRGQRVEQCRVITSFARIDDETTGRRSTECFSCSDFDNFRRCLSQTFSNASSNAAFINEHQPAGSWLDALQRLREDKRNGTLPRRHVEPIRHVWLLAKQSMTVCCRRGL